MTILYTPANIPKILLPEDDQWNALWAQASSTKKVQDTHNGETTAVWKGLYLQVTDHWKPVYDMPVIKNNSAAQFIVDQVQDYLKLNNIVIFIWENLRVIDYHTDYSFPIYQFRSILWNTYTTPVWKFKRLDQEKPMILPNDTNSFIYLDHDLQHSAIYDQNFTKGVLIIAGLNQSQMNHQLKKIAERSVECYPDFSWKTD